MSQINLGEVATFENFNELGYLEANFDVRTAVAKGMFKNGIDHFNTFGKNENRLLYSQNQINELSKSRNDKMKKIAPFIREELTFEREGDKLNFLTKSLQSSFNIVETENVSANKYDDHIIKMIDDLAEGIILDCGAGLRNTYYSNVYNYEIVDYVTTDIIGVGEVLPFKDNTFDGIISIAVLEHVKDPFKCSQEIMRVLKPGGRLISCIPFLQPYHGYPHHYYNMTHQGHANLYEQNLTSFSIEVLKSMKPIHTLTWFLQKYTNGLSDPSIRDRFLKQTVGDFVNASTAIADADFVSTLNAQTEIELACATLLTGVKAK